MYRSIGHAGTDRTGAPWGAQYLIGIGTICLCILTNVPAHGKTVYAQICDQAAVLASQNHGVPLDVMRAITRTETGRSSKGQLQPWPWTVNMEGKGSWFNSESEARNYVAVHFSRGARSFDVGCFQINYRWHGQAFSSIDEMFDPVQNANYAARFLRKLHGEFGSWESAAGAFHSRTPKHANRYIARYQTVIAGLDRAPVPQGQSQPKALAARTNSYPLMKDGTQPKRLGSLVPIGRGTSSLLPRVGG